MGYYAFINNENIVVEVITGKDEIDSDGGEDTTAYWEEHYEEFRPNLTCKRTSYNTHRNTHLLGGTPFRGNFAGKGMTYDATNDIFIHPKPYESWVLDVATAGWKAPIDTPSDTNEDLDTSLPIKNYNWDEDNQAWVLHSTSTWDADAEQWGLAEEV